MSDGEKSVHTPHCLAAGGEIARLNEENARLRAALKEVFKSMDRPGSAGDEYAYEWLHEVWKEIVPEDIRRAVGDTVTVDGEANGS